MNTTASSVLGRKTVAGRQLKEARAMSVPKALRLSLSKSADTLFDLALAVIGATQAVRQQSDLCADFTADKLMLLLDGPNGQPGAALMDKSIVSGLVQQQTMGCVTAYTDEDRPMTRTDAALMAPLLNDVFQRVTDLLETDDDRAILQDFQFGAQVLDPRLIGLSLEENDYHVLKLTLDMAAGTRQGDVLLAFPVVLPDDAQDAQDDPASNIPIMALHDTVMDVKTDLNAVLCKLRVPLREVEQWTVGGLLPIEREALNGTSLHAQTGRKLGVGKLGQKSGHRALRLIKKSDGYSGPDRRGMHALLGDDQSLPDLDTSGVTRPDTAIDLDAVAEPSPAGQGDQPTGEPLSHSSVAEHDDLPDLPPIDPEEVADVLPDLPPLEFDVENQDDGTGPPTSG